MDIKLYNHEQDTRKLQCRQQREESALLEAIEKLEILLDGMENQELDRSSARLASHEESLLTRLNTATGKERITLRRAIRLIRDSQQRTQQSLTKRDAVVEKTMGRLKARMADYLEFKKTIGTRQVSEAMAHCNNDDREAQGASAGGGQSIFGQLGMALFALKSSNAFSNLDKIAKGR